MGVYKLSTAGGLATPRTNYSSFLAGNPAVQFTSYESIATANGTGSSGVITFSSIPQTYKHLQLRCVLGNASGSSTALTINSGSFARRHYLYATGSGSINAGADTSNDLFLSTNTGTTPLITAINIVDILDYTSTTKTKTYRILSGDDYNGSGGVFVWSGLDLSTTAIDTITLTTGSNWSTTTKIALYGIKG